MAGLREAARQLGISHVALMKAVKSGRVAKRQDGSFDVEACRVALDLNTHPGKSRAARTQQSDTASTSPSISERPETFDPAMRPAIASIDEIKDSTLEAVRQLEWEKVREKRLKLDREEGRLVELAPVNAWVAGMIVRARDELMRIPTELRDKLAHETDPLACEAMLLGRMEGVLARLAEFRP
jgi:hypothetical protein